MKKEKTNNTDVSTSQGDPGKTPFFSRLMVRLILFQILLGFVFLGFSYDFFLDYTDNVLRQSIGQESVLALQQAIDRVSEAVIFRIEFFETYAKDPSLAAFIERSNIRFENMEDPLGYIHAQDAQWTAATSSTSTALKQSLSSNSLATELRGIAAFYEKKNGHPVYSEIFVTNKYGANIAQSGTTTDYYQADEKWWQKAREQGIYIGDVAYDASAGTRAIDVGYAITDQEGVFLGVIKVVLDLREVVSIVERVKPEPDSPTDNTTPGHLTSERLSFSQLHLTLVDQNADVIYSNSPYSHFQLMGSHNEKVYRSKVSDHHYIEKPEHRGAILVSHASADIAKVLAPDLPIPMHWTLILDHDESEILQTPHSEIWNFVVSVLLVFAIIFGVALLFLLFFVSRPLTRLIEAARATAQGGSYEKVIVRGAGEITRLAEVFNHMIDTIRVRTKSVEDERAKLLQMTRHMAGGGILLNQKNEALFVNHRARELLDVESNTEYSMIYQIFLQTFDGTGVTEALAEDQQEHVLAFEEVEVGEKIFNVYMYSLLDEEDAADTDATRFILFIDVTEVKQLERSKSELVAVASHQLRTPLTAIRGNVELLLDEGYGKVPDEQRELLRDIESSTVRLIDMVNDMLDITKIERGELDLTIEKVDIVEVVSTVINDLKEYAQRHQFTITHESPQHECYVYGDNLRLQQAFQNLIDNAIKYSRYPGELKITYTVSDTTLTIMLEDNGIGIPESEQVNIYDRFFRASNTAAAASSGTGLGLPIVRSVIEQLGGSIDVTSKLDVGTTFFVTLPTIVNKASNNTKQK